MRNQIIFYLFFLILSGTYVVCQAQNGNARRQVWRNEFTALNIEIDPASGKMKGDARLTLVRSNNGKRDIFLLLNRELKVLSVKDGKGKVLSYDRDSSNLIVRYQGDLFKKDTLDLNVTYEGSFTDRTLEYNFLIAWIGPEISYALSTSRFYPVVANTDFRSRGNITFRIPKDWTVASSGKLAEERLLEDHKLYVFRINSPLVFYFAAAPFKSLRNKIDGVEAGVYLLNGDMKKTRFYMENCSGMVRFMKDYYGIFPYESYSVVEIPGEYLGLSGGGSYEGLTFYRPVSFPNKAFYSPFFGHEIGHLWWPNFIGSHAGPVITEGLAQMTMGLYLENKVGEKVFRELIKNGAVELQLWQTASMYFKFITPADSGKQYLPGIFRGEDLKLGIYQRDKFRSLHTLANCKGFFIYFMLRDLIGQEAFREAMRHIMRHYAWSNDFTLHDLRHELERASGRNLKWFFDQWFFRKGAPEFSLSYEIKSVGKSYQIKVIVDQIREVYRVNAEIVLVNGEKRETRTVPIKSKKTPFSINLPFKPDTILFDPDYKILRWTEEFKN